MIPNSNNEFSTQSDEFEETKFDGSPKRISTKSNVARMSSASLGKENMAQIDE